MTFFIDYTLTTKETLQAKFDFTIFIEPCAISSYFASPDITLIEYFIGDSSLTDGDYGFTQDPACGYDETITVTGLPSFVTHEETDKNFKITSTSDLNLIGVYPVTIKSVILVPTDSTKTDFIEEMVEYTFDIRIEPCQIGDFMDQPMATGITYSVGEATIDFGNYGWV